MGDGDGSCWATCDGCNWQRRLLFSSPTPFFRYGGRICFVLCVVAAPVGFFGCLLCLASRLHLLY